jgi:hypothetical protein
VNYGELSLREIQLQNRANDQRVQVNLGGAALQGAHFEQHGQSLSVYMDPQILIGAGEELRVVIG